MDEHAEALEADLLRFYGVDLLDWHRGRLSARRLTVLVKHLPRESAVHRAQAGESAEWGVTDHLLAAVVDQLAVANWMFATVHQDEDATPEPYPEPVHRPGAADPRPPEEPLPAPAEGPTRDELARFFG